MIKWNGIIGKFKRKAVDNNINVYSLAPNVPDNKKEYDVYEKYLQQAFSDATIKNIAITGNFGVGKSSFLTWFSRRKKYLFISLCDFKPNEKNKINSLEFNLVQQLIVGCKSAYQRKNTIKIDLFILIFVINTLLVFILLSTNCMGCLDILKSLYNNVDFDKILNDSQKYVFFFIILIFYLGLPFLLSSIISNISLKKLSFKTAEIEAELEIENKQNFTFIDFHRAKVVATLKEYCKKFDYTIIFEDMDRLDFDNCVTVFSELREINRLVNIYSAKHNNAKKTVRFIYVIQDGVFNTVGGNSETEKLYGCANNHLKFFDYIIPFIPLYLDEAASNYFLKCLNKLGCKCADEFVDIVGKYIFDYRIIENIINEYCVLRDVYEVNEDCKISNFDEKHIMALSVYKTLMPEDYQKIRMNDSIIQKSSSAHIQCIDQLISHGWLCLDCLKYIGFSEMEIKNYIKELLTSDQWKAERTQIVQNLINNKFLFCREVILNNIEKIHSEVCNEIVKNYGYSLFALEIESSDGGSDLIRTLTERDEELKIEENPTEEQVNIWHKFLFEASSSEIVDDNIINYLKYLCRFSTHIPSFFENIDDRVFLYIFKCTIKLPIVDFDIFLQSIGLVQWINKASNNNTLLRQIIKTIENDDEYIKILRNVPGLDVYIKNYLDLLIRSNILEGVTSAGQA